jgi:hypothetical protein
MSFFLLGLLAGLVLAAALFIGTERTWERRKTSVSATPLSIQTLAVRESGHQLSLVRT